MGSSLAAYLSQDRQSALTRDTDALPNGTTTTLALKVAVAAGPARRFAVGDPNVRRFDVLAGAPLTQVASGEHLARPGEVLIDQATAAALGDMIMTAQWRADIETGERFAVLGMTSDDRRLTTGPVPSSLYHPISLSPEQLRPWLLPAVYERYQAGLGEFLTELRPAISLFLRFGGIDFVGDSAAAPKLDALIHLVQHKITRYDGTLLQLTIGDKGSYLYVVFGAPTAHEDDARRAVMAALELRDTLMADDHLETIQIGISRGVMRVGAYGGPTRQTYGVLGDDVNLAARLMMLAAPGEVLISGACRHRSPPLRWSRAPIHLKGKAEPLPVFAVMRAGRRRAIRLEEPAYALPMVGRQRERDSIVARLDQALAGHGQIVGITAEAGMGKSRLLAEVIRVAQQRGMQGYGGFCRSDGLASPYLVWEPIWQAFSMSTRPHHCAGKRAHWQGCWAIWRPSAATRCPCWGHCWTSICRRTTSHARWSRSSANRRCTRCCWIASERRRTRRRKPAAACCWCWRIYTGSTRSRTTCSSRSHRRSSICRC